jgi:hypothetical protein
MKSLSLIYKFLFFVWLLPSSLTFGEIEEIQSLVPVIYVAPVSLTNFSNDSHTKHLTSSLISELKKSNSYRIANPEESDPIKLVKLWNETGMSLDECYRKEAKILAASQVLITQIHPIGDLCRISMSLEDIYSKEIIKSKNIKSSCSIDDLEDKAVSLLYLLMSKAQLTSVGERKALITSDPAGASVTINNEFIGHTPLSNILIPTGQIRIMMEIGKNDTYAPILVNELVEVSEKTFQYHKVFAQKPAFLDFKLNPSNAQIRINDKVIKLNDTNKLAVPSGESFKLMISADKHEQMEIHIPSLHMNEVYEVEAQLTPKQCEVLISTSPIGVEIKIDDELVGQTPYYKKLKAGHYQFTLEKDFFDSVSSTFFCNPDEKFQRNYELKKARYSKEQIEKIQAKKNLRLLSYVGMGTSIAVGAYAYSQYETYQGMNKKYSQSTDPFEIEKLRVERQKAKTKALNYGAGAVLGLGLSYIIYKNSNFPTDVNKKEQVTIIPNGSGAEVSWQLSW